MFPGTLIVPIEGKGTGREGECGTPQVPKLLMVGFNRLPYCSKLIPRDKHPITICGQCFIH